MWASISAPCCVCDLFAVSRSYLLRTKAPAGDIRVRIAPSYWRTTLVTSFAITLTPFSTMVMTLTSYTSTWSPRPQTAFHSPTLPILLLTLTRNLLSPWAAVRWCPFHFVRRPTVTLMFNSSLTPIVTDPHASPPLINRPSDTVIESIHWDDILAGKKAGRMTWTTPSRLVYTTMHSCGRTRATISAIFTLYRQTAESYVKVLHIFAAVVMQKRPRPPVSTSYTHFNVPLAEFTVSPSQFTTKFQSRHLLLLPSHRHIGGVYTALISTNLHVTIAAYKVMCCTIIPHIYIEYSKTEVFYLRSRTPVCTAKCTTISSHW